MRKFVRCLLLGAVATAALVVLPSDVHAQYPIGVTQVQPVVPAVVGYTAERRGLFGWRVVYRPIVAPVVAGVPASTITVARPVISQPVVVGYAPQAAPVTSYYAAPVAVGVPAVGIPVAPPITTYRIPIPTAVPYIGF